jgi:hypothetical protein
MVFKVALGEFYEGGWSYINRYNNLLSTNFKVLFSTNCTTIQTWHIFKAYYGGIIFVL